jgi:hypothetical protein
MKNDLSNTAIAPATTLPESVRIPLHSLQADLEYLIGRVIADSSCGPMIVKSMRERLDQIEHVLTWRPIKSAPRDGKPILVFRPDSFASGFSTESGIDVVWWDDGSWQTVGDAITVDLPTHWMPLPRSPQASVGRG